MCRRSLRFLPRRRHICAHSVSAGSRSTRRRHRSPLRSRWARTSSCRSPSCAPCAPSGHRSWARSGEVRRHRRCASMRALRCSSRPSTTPTSTCSATRRRSSRALSAALTPSRVRRSMSPSARATSSPAVLHATSRSCCRRSSASSSPSTPPAARGQSRR